jgi:hypothetical protein
MCLRKQNMASSVQSWSSPVYRRLHNTPIHTGNSPVAGNKHKGVTPLTLSYYRVGPTASLNCRRAAKLKLSLLWSWHLKFATESPSYSQRSAHWQCSTVPYTHAGCPMYPGPWCIETKQWQSLTIFSSVDLGPVLPIGQNQDSQILRHTEQQSKARNSKASKPTRSDTARQALAVVFFGHESQVTCHPVKPPPSNSPTEVSEAAAAHPAACIRHECTCTLCMVCAGQQLVFASQHLCS